MKSMRQADGLQTFFVDAVMQADVDSWCFYTNDGDLTKDLRRMLPCWRCTAYSYIRSFIPVDEQLQPCL